MATLLHVTMPEEYAASIEGLPRGLRSKLFKKALKAFLDSPEGKSWIKAAREVG